MIALVVTGLETGTVVVVARPPGRLSDVVAVDAITLVAIQLGGPGQATSTCCHWKAIGVSQPCASVCSYDVKVRQNTEIKFD